MVIPLQYLGVTNTELSKLPLHEVMKHALNNLDEENLECGYAVRHSQQPISDFGTGYHGQPNPEINPLVAAYPILFPYGVSGIEAPKVRSVGFDDHVRWCLQYYDRQFRTHHSFPFVTFSISQKRSALPSARIQMRRKDFEHDSVIINSLSVAEFKQAENEEASHLPISNPHIHLL